MEVFLSTIGAKARDWIYRKANIIKSTKGEALLHPKSWVPTVNTFSEVASYGFGIFVMLVVDFMHEFELGVWKAIFTHLICMLVAHGDDAVQALNDRYRQVPTFGQATIRQFKDNASAMKKLTARNFEDLSQEAGAAHIPPVEAIPEEPTVTIAVKETQTQGGDWLRKNQGDPAIKDFRPKLQEHLLGRLLHPTWSGNGQEFSPQQRNRLLIVNDRIYRHKVLRINYTSYDIHHEATDGHPFAYARIMVSFTATFSKIWTVFPQLPVGSSAGVFTAYGFLDPDEVIRGSHLIPAFAHGPTDPVTYTTLARKGDEFDDWRYHYVNFFVDRDMFMRYLGGGVGHYQVNVPDEDPEESAQQYDDDPENANAPNTPNSPPPADDTQNSDKDEDSEAEEEEEIEENSDG
ncbi:hypothetical protein B0H14DRAFT_3447001 [Mycena olivaceomarginata]|nr:hypothetical protein B0H14DRAFT_3447001 [Mycena olivaceomarginata]